MKAVPRSPFPALVAVLAMVAATLFLSAPSADAASWAVVKRGQSGANVTAVQYLLNYRSVSTDVDGIFGSGTESSVRTFQSRQDLSVDGVVGTNTWKALTPKLRDGSKNTAVKALQTLLRKHGHSLTVDGSFGPATTSAVRSFQSSHGLSVDGVVGPQTWSSLTTGGSGGSGSHHLPVKGEPRSEYDDPHHDYPAIDLAVPSGYRIYAVADGTASSYSTSGCGYGMVLNADGATMLYCHMSRRAFTGSRSVEAGDVLGYVGSTGNSTGPHLHFQIRANGTLRCPQRYLLAIYDGRSVPSTSSLPTSGCSY